LGYSLGESVWSPRQGRPESNLSLFVSPPHSRHGSGDWGGRFPTSPKYFAREGNDLRMKSPVHLPDTGSQSSPRREGADANKINFHNIFRKKSFEPIIPRVEFSPHRLESPRASDNLDSPNSPTEVIEDWSDDFDGKPLKLAQLQKWVETDDDESEMDDLVGNIGDLQTTLSNKIQKAIWSDTTSDCDLSDFDTSSPRYLSSNSNGPDEDNSNRNRPMTGVSLNNLKHREDLAAWIESDDHDLDFEFDKSEEPVSPLPKFKWVDSDSDEAESEVVSDRLKKGNSRSDIKTKKQKKI